MPDVIECPSCQRRLQVPPETMGREVACPACGKTFRADNTHVTSARPAIAPAADNFYSSRPMDFAFAGDELEATRPLIGAVDGWRKVRSGVSLIWLGTLVQVGLVVLAVCGGVAFAAFAASRGMGGGGDLATTIVFVGVAVI